MATQPEMEARRIAAERAEASAARFWRMVAFCAGVAVTAVLAQVAALWIT